MTVPALTVIVLNWNNATDTLACLESLSRQDYPHRILVVDNGSTDDSVSRLRAAFPEVEILETGENLGYAGGNNVGIRHALEQGAEYLFILNNDVVLAPDCLSRLMEAAENDPMAGFIGPMIYQREELERIQSAGIMANRHWEWHHRGLNELDRGQYSAACCVDVLSGCALLARRQVLERIGLLDERFYLYDEDIDWCLRARGAGFRNTIIPSAKVWHRSTNVRGGDSPRLTYYINRNRYLLFQKHCAPLTVRARHLAMNVIWLLNWSVNPKWRNKRKERNALFKALLDAAQGHFGKAAW